MAEGFKGSYAPELYNELKRYYLLQAQEKTSLTDAELRDLHEMANTFTRRFIQGQVGDSAVGTGFRIGQHPSDPVNNFLIEGGQGTLDAPGVLFLKGYRLSLRGGIGYKDQTDNGDITTDAYTATDMSVLTTPVGTTGGINAVASSSGGVLVAVGDSGSSLRSTDAGRCFTDTSSYPQNLYDVVFADSVTGFAVGNTGRILRSLDSGATWTPIISPGNPNLHGVTALNASSWWAVGVGTIIHSDPVEGLSIQAAATTLNSVDAYDPTHIWAVGCDGKIVFSADGLNWSDQSGATDETLNGVTALSASVVLACGNNGAIQKTLDGGTNWYMTVSDTAENLNDICFDGISRGWAVGDNGVVTRTLNGGMTWDSTTIDPAYDFKSVVFTDATGFAAGSGGIVYRTLDDGTTWERYRTDYVYVDFHLAEVSGDQTSEYTDSTLIDPVVGSPSANRLRTVQDVKVSEGWESPADYVHTGPDGTPQQHHTYTLAKIQRYVGVSAIGQADITDMRSTCLTVSDINKRLGAGGLNASVLADGSIEPTKMNQDSDYTLGSLQILRDSTVGGDLRVEGVLHVEDQRASLTIESLLVNGSSRLGDTTSPYDDTSLVYGQIIQKNDVDAPAYDLHSYAATLNSPVMSILQDGSGNVFRITKTNDSAFGIIDVTSAGRGYDVLMDHTSASGGLFRAFDYSVDDSIQIIKDATGSSGSVISLTTNSYGPAVRITNTALCPSSSIRIDQSGGSALTINSVNDASSVVIRSTGTGTDLRILHGHTAGAVIDMTSYADTAILVDNEKGQVARIIQKDSQNLVTLMNDNTGAGRVIEVYSHGFDPAVQVNTDGSGIGIHVSHTGDSTVPAVDIYVDGNERGPALRITKANHDGTDDVGQAIYVDNKGYSQAVQILQDNTDSTASAIELANRGSGCDFSSANWKIDGSGNFTTGGKMFLNHLTAGVSLWFDGTNLMATRSDGSNAALTSWS